MIINCLGIFGMNNLKEIERMTLREYDLRLKAYKVNWVEKEHVIYTQAWANAVARSTKKSGKSYLPKYKSFKEFYDYKKRLEEAYKSNDDNDLTSIGHSVMEAYRRKKDG